MNAIDYIMFFCLAGAITFGYPWFFAVMEDVPERQKKPYRRGCILFTIASIICIIIVSIQRT